MQSKLTILIITTVITLSTLLLGSSRAAPASSPTVCDPAVFDEMPPHIKKVCAALENSSELVNALRLYLRNEAAALIAPDLSPVSAAKRNDVDHMFLRFGKR